MNIKPFKLERYFAKYEFSAPYLLSSSDCEALTLQELLQLADTQTLKLWEKLKLGYTESLGHPLLRQEIAKLYSKVKADDVLVVVPEEGIFIAMNVLLNQGDHVISTFPGYQSLYEVASSLGCEVSKWIPEEEDSWKFNLTSLKSMIKPHTKLIVINFPHNPTGSTVSQEEFQQILLLAQKHHITVFCDEMYRLLEYEAKDRLTSAADLYDNAISLFGVSKSFALAGLRLGWLTTRNKQLYQKLAVFKDYTTICNSAPSEILSLMALRAKAKIIDRSLKIISSNLSLLDKFFTKYSQLFTWVKPKAGSIAFPKLTLSTDISQFCLDLVNKKGVMLLPSSVYDYDGNNFRVGLGRNTMPQALERLEEYLQEYVLG